MSLAPFWMADISTTLTSLMTGASPPCRSSDSALISSISWRTSTSSAPASVISSIDFAAISSALGPRVDRDSDPVADGLGATSSTA